MTQIVLDDTHRVLLVNTPVVPEADEFELWTSIFLNQEKISIIETHQGADRHQTRFDYAGNTFNINFEHYTDSIWIVPEGIESDEQLTNLSEYLLTSFQ